MIERKLPMGWLEVELKDIIKVASGDGLTSKNMIHEGGIPVYGGNGVNGYHNESNTNEETIVIGRVGFYCGSVHLTPSKAWITDNALRVSFSKENLSLRFIYWLLKATNLRENQSSTAQPVISGAKIYQTKIPLPPLAEQKRIVAKLDKAFHHLDTLKAKLDRIPELLKNFRQAVLTQAVTGKLTEEWRNENNKLQHSLELFQQIRLSKKSTSKNSVIVDSESVDVPFDIPNEWIFINLGELCEKLTYGTSAKSDNDGDVPVLRMGNLQKGRIDWTDLKYTSDNKEIEKYALTKGDVLFNRTNSPELVGKTSIYESNDLAIYAGYLIKIWNYEELDSYYLNYVLNSPYAKKWAWEAKSDGVSQSNINAQKLSNFIIPFPSLEEQKEIVKKVEALFAKADAIEAYYASLKEKIDKLPQALLAKAFRGELVSQDPNDEPASLLLERIKAGKNGFTETGKKKKSISKKDQPLELFTIEG